MAPTIADKVQEVFDLERLMLPLDKHLGDCPLTFPILYSKDIWTNPKLVVIVLGAGKVELCIWSRSLCINKSLGKGSVMKAVHEAMVVRGCAVLLTNPNINVYSEPVKRRIQRVPGNGSPEDHLHYLYRLFIQRCPAKEIAILAHSFGGVATMSLLSRPDVRDDLLGKGRLKSITLTDSVHSSGMSLFAIDKATKKWLAKNAINWIRSQDPIGTEYTPQCFTQRQSAGTTDHASTNYTTVEVQWKWIDERMTRTPIEAEAASDVEIDADNAFAKISEDLAAMDLTYKEKKNGARDAKTKHPATDEKPKPDVKPVEEKPTEGVKPQETAEETSTASGTDDEKSSSQASESERSSESTPSSRTPPPITGISPHLEQEEPVEKV